MKIDANDPRWTAYALGEIEDEQERVEIERLLEGSPEMRRLVEEIRNTGNLLSQELKAEPAVDLTSSQRRRIAEKANPSRSWFGLRPAWVMAAAAAAMVLVSVLAIRHLKQEHLILERTQVAALEAKESSSVRSAQSPAFSAQDLSAKKTETLDESTGKVSGNRVHSATSAAIKSQANNNEMPSLAAPAQAIPAHASAPSQAMDSIGVIGGVVKPEDTVFGNVHQTFGFVPSSPPVSVGPGSGGGIGTGVGTGIAARNLNIQRDSITVSDARWPGPVPPPPPCCGRPPLLPIQRLPGKFNTEAYDRISDNPFLDVVQNPLSTFSIDVDTASYSNMRRFLDGGNLPPKDSIRIEELVNYFDYDYKGPKDDKPFAVNFELTEAPWAPEHRLLRIGLKGREVKQDKRQAGNLVFLLDVSGSMADPNKLPLIKESMRLLVDRLTETDRIAIVVYASDADVLLPRARGDQKEKIMQAVDRLHAGGSTNGASGIQLAYRTAQENFIPGGTNRIILATDGDFNVGITNRGDLTRLIEEKAKSGIYLSALGFGMGNYKDATLELLANKGHGNYAYIDTLNEAKKVLVEQIDSTLVAIAKDVKIQVEFNPRFVSAYRLIGYEDRVMAKEDFNDDAKDAGVIGAGHAVTALYELLPPGASVPEVDALKYQKPPKPSSSAESNELVTVKIRSKEPEKDKSVLSEFTVKESKEKFTEASQDFKFAAGVAAFGMVLRDSPYKGRSSLDRALEWAQEGKGEDRHGYRQEFIRLIHRAISLAF